MPSEEEEMALTRWRDLLGTELILALEGLSKVRKDSVNKQHQHYVESCAEQYWTIIARITGTIGRTNTEPGNVPSAWDDAPARQDRAINVTIAQALARLKSECKESRAQ
jgi:hypothetical protein